MKKTLSLLVVALLLFMSCPPDDSLEPETLTATLSFTHNWDATSVTSGNFNTIQYTNANGEQLSIERLRYLISDVTFIRDNGEAIIIDGYNLVDVTNAEGLSYTVPNQLPKGTYTSVSFTFGLDTEDNVDGAYLDLNSASFNVPMMLGGGYHYMQFDGKYIDDTATVTGFNYHTIRAVDNPGANPTFPQDTFFEVDLGPVTINNDATLEVKMNIAEWFKNPNTWNLNDLDTVLMPNSAAQIMMHENGKSVFSLGAITE